MLTGLLIILLGVWGGLIPFIGPYFHFAYSPDRAWAFTSGRFWLEILPSAGAILGGLIMLTTASRAAAHFGALLAAASGAWFMAGGLVSTLWTGAATAWTGVPAGGPLHQAAESIAFFYGLGTAVVFFAGLALGRFAVVGVREARDYVPPSPTSVPEEAPAGAGASGREPAKPADRTSVLAAQRR